MFSSINHNCLLTQKSEHLDTTQLVLLALTNTANTTNSFPARPNQLLVFDHAGRVEIPDTLNPWPNPEGDAVSSHPRTPPGVSSDTLALHPNSLYDRLIRVLCVSGTIYLTLL